MGEKKKPWPSKAIILNCGLLLLTFATLGSGVMCPDKCICDDKNLKHDCSDSGLEGIPIFFNPETKEIKVGPYNSILDTCIKQFSTSKFENFKTILMHLQTAINHYNSKNREWIWWDFMKYLKFLHKIETF